MRRFVLLAALMWPLTAPQTAHAPTSSLQCRWELSTAHVNGEHGQGLTCPLGTLRNFTDVEGGVYVPGDPTKLNLNLAGGNARHRGYVVLSPDNGKGTLLEDGHRHKLLLVRAPRYGGTEFRTGVRFRAGLVVCDRHGCLDVLRALRRRR